LGELYFVQEYDYSQCQEKYIRGVGDVEADWKSVLSLGRNDSLNHQSPSSSEVPTNEHIQGKEATSEELQWACNALDTVSLLAFATWRDLNANYVCRVALTVSTVQTQLKLICELGESKGQRLAGSHNPFCDACWCSTRISTQKRAGKCPAAATASRIYIRSEDFRT
jgi:hypothetical protein